MKKSVTILLAILLVVVMLATVACKTGPSSTETKEPSSTKPSESVTDPVASETKPSESKTEPEESDTNPPPPVVKDIKLEFSSTDDLTVAAGEKLTLPTVKATDYDGTDLTASVSVEDPYESGTVKDGVFTGIIAGEHELFYYVEVEDKEAPDGYRSTEQTIKVVVTPAIANTFVTEGFNSITQMTDYGIFKDGFEAGKKSVLGAAIGDANGATHISGTSEAIEGNSLVIDFNKTSGSALNAVFLQAFNDVYHRGEATTYKVKFSYKILAADNNYNDVYFGLSWDGFDGLNNRFVQSGAEVGKVYTYETQFSSAKVPDGGNAYFIFFKLSGSNSDIRIAVDNFEIETVKLTPVNEVKPGAEQLESENGFTWNFGENGAFSTNGETLPVGSLADAMKEAMAGNEHFHDNVMKLTNADGHLFSGLTADALVAGKKLIIDMYYYAVNDKGFHLIMMGSSGNPTLDKTVENVTDQIKHVHAEVVVPAGWYQLNIYGQNNGDFEIYIGEITVKLVDNVVEENKTPLDHVIGEYTYTQDKRAFGFDTDKGITEFDGFDFGSVANLMGAAPSKFFYEGITADRNIEWFNAGGKVFETGYWYRITMTYYVVKYEGGNGLMYNFDNGAFIAAGTGDYMSEGYHVSSIKWQANSNVNFMSIYDKAADGETLNAHYYVKDIKIALIHEDDPAEEVVKTPNGHVVGEYAVTQDKRQWGTTDKGSWNCTDYDSFDFGADASKMGAAPTKFVFKDAKNITMEWFQPAGKVLENGYKYRITVRFYVESWEGDRFMLNFDNNEFLLIDTSPAAGYHEATIEWTANRNVDFFSFYIPGDTTINGVIYIADVTISLIG